MLPLLLAVAAGGLIAKKMTDYPAEIRNLRKQMPKEEREDFIREYKQLPNETKTQFKQYLREANLVEASKLIGKDLTSYNVKTKEKKEEQQAALFKVSLIASGYETSLVNEKIQSADVAAFFSTSRNNLASSSRQIASRLAGPLSERLLWLRL